MLERLQTYATLRRAQNVLNRGLDVYTPLFAAVLTWLRPDWKLRAGDWPREFTAAGIRSVLELGPGSEHNFLGFLDKHLPPGIELTGIDPVVATNRSGRLRTFRGEAADLPNILPGKQFDLIVCNGMFSRQRLTSEQYTDLLGHGQLIVRQALAALSKRPKAALVIGTYQIDALLLSRQRFEKLGAVRFWEQYGRHKQVGRTVLLQPQVSA
jgi:hypothetical protein